MNEIELYDLYRVFEVHVLVLAAGDVALNPTLIVCAPVFSPFQNNGCKYLNRLFYFMGSELHGPKNASALDVVNTSKSTTASGLQPSGSESAQQSLVQKYWASKKPKKPGGQPLDLKSISTILTEGNQMSYFKVVSTLTQGPLVSKTSPLVKIKEQPTDPVHAFTGIGGGGGESIPKSSMPKRTTSVGYVFRPQLPLSDMSPDPELPLSDMFSDPVPVPSGVIDYDFLAKKVFSQFESMNEKMASKMAAEVTSRLEKTWGKASDWSKSAAWESENVDDDGDEDSEEEDDEDSDEEDEEEAAGSV